jgi:2,4-dienoyl-CoA reductase-like NADH-dependent reductase (Old Yellow Enzyme family)/thioredoxin reductase
MPLNSLFSSIQIGTMTAKNRLLMPAMSINFGVDEFGHVTDQLTEYFVVRARGGTGLLLVGGGAVHPTGLELPKLPTLWDDRCIPALTRMTEAVRPFGAKFGMQLMHGGRQSYHDQKVAPSPIPAPAVVKGIPKELSRDEIGNLVKSFGDAARRCQQAGFDFIEIHAAHGYLINQFMSPNANRRSDVYGGTFENRIRFLLELFRDIKHKTGGGFPIGLRINGQDYIQDGWTLEEAMRLSRILQEEGADYLHISAGVYGSSQLTIPSMYVPHGCFVHLAQAVKQQVSIPVVAVGRIKHPDQADRIIREGRADIVAMGRAHLADPELARKAQEGKLNQIRPCIGCCVGCIHSVLALEPGGCVVNPDVGREYQLKETIPAAHANNVLVLGSGPAGLAAARMTALRGHRTCVIEEKGQVGGAARLAAIPPGRSEVGEILEFFVKELERLGVELRLNTRCEDELIRALKPDVVLLATGSLPEMPIVKGLFQTRMQLCTVMEVLDGRTLTGNRVLVLGGSQAALVLSDFLAEQGREVVVLNRKKHFAEEMSSNDRFYLRERLKKGLVQLYKGVSIQSVFDDGLRMRCQTGQFSLDGFDTMVLAEKMTPIRKPAERFKTEGMAIHLIGDAKQPRTIQHAISEGEELGRSL